MKNLKFFVFMLIAVFTFGLCFNVNAEDVNTVSNLDELNEALSQGGNVKLSADITGEVVIPSEKTVILDLGGKTITALSGKVAITNNGTLTIEGEGNVIANGNYAVLNHGAKLTIENGSYSKTNESASQSLISNGWYEASDNTSGEYSQMIINGGSFDGGTYTAIKNDSYGKMTINGGTINTTPNQYGVYSYFGIQEAGTSMIINGGTINSKIEIDNLSSVADEVKTVKLNGGTFNGEIATKGYTGTDYTKASEVNISVEEDAIINSSLNIANSSAPSGTIPFILEKLDVKNIGGSLTIGGKDANNMYPSVTLDGLTIGGSITLSYVEPSFIKNTTVNGSEVKAGNVELENVKVKNFANNAKDATVTFKGNTTVNTIKVTSNVGNSIIVNGATIGAINSNGNNKMAGYENITIKDGSVDSITATKGNIKIEGGSVGTITIENKVTANVVSVDVLSSGLIDKINNLRENSESYEINLPKNTYIDEQNNVKTKIGNYDLEVKGSYTYNSKPIIPEVVLKDEDGEEVSIDDSNFEVVYYNNVNSGQATVTINGINRYEKTVSSKFTINKADISNMDVSGIVDKEYTGQAITQNLSIEGLTSDDYDVTYANNTAIGTAEITITGKNNYTGEISKTFEITKADISNYEVTGINNNEFYTGKAITQNIEVKNGSVTLVKDTDYEIAYSNNINVGAATITITGKGNYTGTINKTFNIVQNNIDNLNISGIKDVTYTGQAITQANLVIKNGDMTLDEGTDYKIISYSNNINVGTATIIINGEGKYTGEAKRTFKIKPIIVNAKDIKVTGIINRLYTGKARKQDNVKVTYKGKTIPYSISYKNNTNIGTASVIITFKGNYKGTVTKNFDILPVKIGIKTVKGKKKKMKVSYYAAAGNVKYQIAYRKNGTKKWKYVTTNAGSKTIKKLKSRKYYTVTVRAFKVVNGKTYYGAWSDMKSVRVK